MEASSRKRSALGAVVTIGAIILVAILLMTPAVQGFLRDLVASPFQSRYPESATFTVERIITIDANGGEVVDYAFDITEPVNITQNGVLVQEVSSVSYSPAATWSGEKYGQDWIYWNGTDLSGQASRTYTATYTVVMRTQIWDIDQESSLSVNDIPQALKDQYLVNEWKDDSSGSYKIDMTSSLIKAQSKDIVGDETDVYLILRSIYDWMVSNIRYPTVTTSAGPQSALETLEMRVGDCDDQSILFCSLARAAGVPAWLQLGALYQNAESAWGGHAWLQAYVPLGSGEGENVTIDIVNKDFLVLRPNRFVDYTDDGNGAHLSDYYYTFSSQYEMGSVPIYSDEYNALSYEESSRKISQGAVYDIDRDVTLACSGPARPRR